MDIAIVGAGWAGLATAIELLSEDNQNSQNRVFLYEAAQQAGGRARSVSLDGKTYDNGQHLFIGAYHGLFSLLDKIGISANSIFFRTPLRIQAQQQDATILKLKTPSWLPAPIDLLSAIVTAKGFDWTDKYRLLHGSRAMLSENLVTDCSVAALLAKHRQTQRAIKLLWEPLCIGALNTAIENGSAQIFMNVLQQTFTTQTGNADFMIATQDLGASFPEPALKFVRAHEGEIFLGERVQTIKALTNNKFSLTSGNSNTREFDQVVLATPPQITHKLLAEIPKLEALKNSLTQFSTQPITTVYLRYPQETRLEFPMLGLHSALTQWLFDRRICGQNGCMAAVVSLGGAHMQLSKQALAAQVADEIALALPHWPKPTQSYVVREKRATFHCTPGINQIRPQVGTEITGLYLAGDYTDTGLPATLEGAIQSGIKCAHQILSENT